MKKVYLMLLMAFVAIAASAQDLYLMGSMSNPAWAASEDWKFSKDGNIYTLTGKSLTATDQFKVADANWGTHNYGASASTTTVSLNEPTVLLQGSDSKNLTLGVEVKNVTFTFDLSTKTLTVTEEGGEVVNPDPSPENPEDGIYHIYFDNSSANWSAPRIWAWCAAHQDHNFTGGQWPGELMTKIEVNGTEYYYFAVDVTTDTQSAGHDLEVLFNNGNDQEKTSNLALINNGIYTKDGFTGNYVTKDEEEEKPVDPQDPVTIYFNAGADLFDASKMNNNAPFIQGYNVTDKKFEDLGQMTLVEGRDALFFFTIEHPEKYQGVNFYAENAEGTRINWYSTNSKAFDAKNWATFIYGTGNGIANQSYMTFEELEDLRSGDKDNIYFLGDGIGQATAWDTENLLSVNDVRADGTARGWLGEGLYVRAFSRLDGNGGKFKMSSVNPVIYRAAHDQQADGDRWWATFNLGIVGFIGDDKQINREEGDVNGYVNYTVNEIEEYRNYNQYDWQFTFPSDNTVDEYYLVIDSYYHTTALIPFKPMPTLQAVTAGEFQSFKFEDTETGDLATSTTGNILKGTATSGEARLSHYNSATGTAAINVSPGVKENLWAIDYNVEYGIYNGNDLVTRFNGNKDADRYTLDITNMVAGDEAELSVRCIYTEPESTGGLCFRSMSTSKTIEVKDTDFPAFDIKNVKSALYNNEKGWNLAVSFDAELEHEAGELTVYPDFEVKNSKGCKVTLVDVEHEATNHFDFINGIHTKYTEGSYIHDTHNWTRLIKGDDLYHFELVIEGIAANDAEDPHKCPESLKSKDIDFTICASYPFLTDDNKAPEVTSWKKIGEDEYEQIEQLAAAPRRAGDLDTQAEGTNYKLALMSEPTTYNINTDGSGMSSITDAIVNGDLNPEYYNLQGVRVEGELAPGIYLRRTGTTTTKVVIK